MVVTTGKDKAMTVTKDQALTADLFHRAAFCTDKRVERWRRNGKTQTWKTRPDEFRVPVKFGLYGYGNITDLNAGDFHVAEECPVESQRGR